MKRTQVFVIASLFILWSSALRLEAESLDKTVATIRLAKTTDTIFLSELKKQIEGTQALNNGQALSADMQKALLDGMIAQRLFIQAADRDKVQVTPEQLKNAVDMVKLQAMRSAGINQDITDAQWQQIVKSNTGMPYEDWLKQFKATSVLPQVYVMQKRGQEITGIPAPTDAEVQDFYDANKSQFLRRDMVSISHILVDTTNLTNQADRDKALKHAEDIAREVRSSAAFKDLVVKYSEDTANKYKDGRLGWVDRENAQHKQMLGAEIFNAIFKMKPGDVSGVLPSPRGYHIVRVEDRLDAKVLGLEESYPTPDSKVTVKEYIRANLFAQKQNTAATAAMKDLGASLRQEAESVQGIRIFQENLPW